MFGAGSMMSVSKLKSLSSVLGCSFSSLRYSLRSSSTPHIKREISKCGYLNFKALSLNFVRTLSTEQTVEKNDEIDMLAVTEGNADLLKKLKVLMLEVEVLRQEGQRVPNVLLDQHWKELLSKPTRSQRIKQLAFWSLNEKRKLADKMKKEEAKRRRESDAPKIEEKKKTDHIYYGLGGSTLFLRIYDSAIDNQMNFKLIRAMMFGQPLIVDCSYDENMTPKEASLCAKQLCFMFANNRLNDEPFNLYFCNALKESKVMKKLSKLIPTIYDDAFPLNITEKSYLDLFPKERLVYLTPHCRHNLNHYNHDDVYIIGAMVDKVNNDPLSLAKAKSLDLRMAKLPLDLHLEWGLGTKSLTLNQVHSILLDMKVHGDWNMALQHVPKRKLKKEEDENNSKKAFHYLRKRKLLL